MENKMKLLEPKQHQENLIRVKSMFHLYTP